MGFVRVVAILSLAVILSTLQSPPLASAQVTDFACEDFLTQAAAQSSLDRFPNDPYGLDPDGNGIACDSEDASFASSEESASNADSLAATPGPLEGRLGGTLEAWQAAFGQPVVRGGENAELFTEYEIPQMGTVYADDHLGRIERVSLFAPRPEGEEWSDAPHPMNWTVDEAHVVAQQFLPRDARVDEILDEAGFGFVHGMCSSDALAAEVPQELYDYVDDSPQYGQCSYTLWYPNFEKMDQISRIVVQLQIEEPPIRTVPTQVSGRSARLRPLMRHLMASREHKSDSTLPNSPT